MIPATICVPSFVRGIAQHGRKRRLLAVTGAILLFAGLAAAEPKPDIKSVDVAPLDVTATPIATFGRAGSAGDTGKLEWRGGLVLTSDNKNFGGWSGLVVEPGGRRFLSVSDSGVWMSGELMYTGTTLSGLQNTRFGPFLTRNGQKLGHGRDRDAEAVALVSGTLDQGNFSSRSSRTPASQAMSSRGMPAFRRPAGS